MIHWFLIFSKINCSSRWKESEKKNLFCILPYLVNFLVTFRINLLTLRLLSTKIKFGRHGKIQHKFPNKDWDTVTLMCLQSFDVCGFMRMMRNPSMCYKLYNAARFRICIWTSAAFFAGEKEKFWESTQFWKKFGPLCGCSWWDWFWILEMFMFFCLVVDGVKEKAFYFSLNLVTLSSSLKDLILIMYESATSRWNCLILMPPKVTWIHENVYSLYFNTSF